MKQIYEVTYQPKDTITDWVYSVSIVKAEKEDDIFKFYENKDKKVIDIIPCSEALEEAKKKGKSIIEIESAEAETKNENNITVKTRQEAWKVADEIFTADYDKDERRSSMAGYPIYTNRINNDQIADLKDRLEITVDGKVTNIWVEYDMEENIAEMNKGENDMPELKRMIEENLAALQDDDNTRVVFWKKGGKWKTYQFTLEQYIYMSKEDREILLLIKEVDNEAVAIGMCDLKSNWYNNLMTLDEMADTIEYRRKETDYYTNINVFLEKFNETKQQAEQEQQVEQQTEIKPKEIGAKDIQIIKGCNGNEYRQIDFDRPCGDKTRLGGTIKAKKADGKYLMEHTTKETNLKKENRRTLNDVMFAKIV